MIYYKFDVIDALKKRGYNQTFLQKNRIINAQTIQNIKAGKSVTLETLNRICIMLRMQPGDVIGVTPSDDEKIQFFDSDF